MIKLTASMASKLMFFFYYLCISRRNTTNIYLHFHNLTQSKDFNRPTTRKKHYKTKTQQEIINHPNTMHGDMCPKEICVQQDSKHSEIKLFWQLYKEWCATDLKRNSVPQHASHYRQGQLSCQSPVAFLWERICHHHKIFLLDKQI